MMFAFSINGFYANSIDDKKEEGNTSKTVSTDTVKIKKETIFEMNFNETTDLLTVDVDGLFDKYSSVSVTNNRGSEYLFQFIKEDSNQLEFDLSNLEKGSYFLVLNTNSEIRIKRFQIN